MRRNTKRRLVIWGGMLVAWTAVAGVARTLGDRAPADEPWTPPGRGWVCLGDVCKRREDARILIGRPQTVERATAWVSVEQDADGAIDYHAGPTWGSCEERRYRATQGRCEEMP